MSISVIDTKQNTKSTTTTLESEFADVLAEAKAIPANDLVQVNVDITQAYATVTAKIPAIAAIVPQMVAKLRDVDANTVARLERYVTALYESHTDYLALANPKSVADLVASATELRSVLLSDAQALVRRGVISESELGEMRGTSGHKNIAQDLSTLAKVIRANWSKCQGRTFITEDELEQTKTLATSLLRIVGDREIASKQALEAADTRQRIFTLFVNAYEQIRYAVWYVRREEGDAENIAPSLYAGRGRRNPSSKDNGEESGVVVAPPSDSERFESKAEKDARAQEAEAKAAAEAQAKKELIASLPGGNPFIG